MGGPLTDQTLVPRNRGAPEDPFPKKESSTKSVARRLAAFKAKAGQPAPDVGAPSPARHSLPCPESRLRDQPARGRTTGKPVPPGGFGPV